MLLALLILPFAAGFASFFIYGDTLRRGLLVGAAATECALVASCWIQTPAPLLDGVLALDAPGLLVLTIASFLFLAASFYAVDYLAIESETPDEDFRKRLHITNAPEAVFTACLHFFLGTAVLVCMAQNTGLLWVGIEGTTLAGAPLIYFHRHRQSLEATWKYLIICCVGIALALVGNVLLEVAWQSDAGSDIPSTISALIASKTTVNEAWFKAAFIFIFIGYGTKMGIAPMHTWLPDAYSEAPSIVSALLSGALINCAFLGILRMYQLSIAAGYGMFSQEIFRIFGLLSMGFAAMFIISQREYKRMLAYSSVEHMGILILSLGVGGMATQGGMLHLLCHSLTKACLFLLAGNILGVFHTKSTLEISGLTRVMPYTGPMWMAAFLAIAGSPPFGLFTSEFTILRGMMDAGYLNHAYGIVPLLYLLFIGCIFVGMATSCLRMCQGLPPQGIELVQERPLRFIPPAVLLAGALVLGLYQPQWLRDVLTAAAQTAGSTWPL